jgi:hypothetical protein
MTLPRSVFSRFGARTPGACGGNGARKQATAHELAAMRVVGGSYTELATRAQRDADALPTAIEYFRQVALEVVEEGATCLRQVCIDSVRPAA